jgi:hypothetical protein
MAIPSAHQKISPIRSISSIPRTMKLSGEKTTSWPFVPRHSEPVARAVDDDLPSLGQANTLSRLPRALGWVAQKSGRPRNVRGLGDHSFANEEHDVAIATTSTDTLYESVY